MAVELVKMLAASLMGTLGFGVLLQAPRRSLLCAALIGSFSYLIYWALLFWGAPEMLCMFCGAASGSLLAQLAARKMRMAGTIFMTLAVIPLVPGLGLYRSMAYLAQGMNALGAQAGVQAMMNVLMIALGMGVGSFLFRTRRVEKRRHHRG